MHFVRLAPSCLLIAGLILPALSSVADGAPTQALHQPFHQDWEYQMVHDPVRSKTKTGVLIRPADPSSASFTGGN